MLMDSVVREIDRIALEQNTNRSNIVNQILAEYVSMTTPEKRIANIFRSIEEFIGSETSGIVPHVTPNQMSMSLRSSLQYKYRPTIRYEVSLLRVPERGVIGELAVVLRTQSAALISCLTDFFRFWTALEEKYRGAGCARYAMYDSKFTRTIQLETARDYTSEELGNRISSYIRMLDSIMKRFIGGCPPHELENIYVSYLNKGVGLI